MGHILLQANNISLPFYLAPFHVLGSAMGKNRSRFDCVAWPGIGDIVGRSVVPIPEFMITSESGCFPARKRYRSFRNHGAIHPGYQSTILQFSIL